MKSERTFNLMEGLKSLFKVLVGDPYYHESRCADPSLVTFARLGLLAYYR